MVKSNKPYSAARKKRLKKKIEKIKNKRDLVMVYDIIVQNEEVEVTKNRNGMFMLFHEYKDDTYRKIDKIMRKINKKRKYYVDSETHSTEDITYKPYAVDKFPSQKKFSPKFKYSNREKNIINRRKYDQNINSENENDAIYAEFNAEILCDSSDKMVEHGKIKNRLIDSDNKVKSKTKKSNKKKLKKIDKTK